MKNTAAMISAAVLAFGVPCGGAAAGDSYMVVAHAKAIDGGSFADRSGNRYRLHAVETPELGQQCQGANGDDYACGEEARKALEDLIGGIMTCNPVEAGMQELRIVRCYDFAGRDIGARLIATGWALPDRSTGVAMDYVWGEMEAEARSLGLWQGRFVLR
ncbi:thermonuclease family protein [Oricola sp.]|uniref:thermonuclease family protein n=1 Tax=Oricola sp. TaxID=1979950 RepID=UPI0025D8EE2B|nr:thermonuclease family protein [Oricola sp.]MCI5078395.1 thermonuclease family protein [Oricola sp.]